MGWTKRDGDVKYIKGLQNNALQFLLRLAASRRPRSSAVEEIPQKLSDYVRLSSMVTQPVDGKLVRAMVGMYSKRVRRITLEIR